MKLAHSRPSRQEIARAIDGRFATPASAAEFLVAMAWYLSAEDRALLHAVYLRGCPLREIASIRGTSPKSVRCSVRRLVHRCSDPAFASLVRAHTCLPPNQRRVARACLIEGRSQRDAARALGMTLHEVRRHLERARERLALLTAKDTRKERSYAHAPGDASHADTNHTDAARLRGGAAIRA